LDPQWRHLIATVNICSPQKGHGRPVRSGAVAVWARGIADISDAVGSGFLLAVPQIPQNTESESSGESHWVQFIVRPFFRLQGLKSL
jgi:hypothetical protein